ncbi:MAG TPA: hypothetical protein VFW00_11825 [Rhodocyclaceae bacterium]|nr:hypothetical protein [Rhodocyclaceae bacterium]
MLRSSNSVVTLSLSPQGFGISGDATQRAPIKPWPKEYRSGDTKSIVDALDGLSVTSMQNKSRLDVVLDNAWTRFQLVRFPAGVRTKEECGAFLKAAFRNVFGAEADAWHIVAEPMHFGLPVLAVAVDAALPEALTKFAERSKLTLRSVQPKFVTAFNGARHGLSAHQGAFAQIDDIRICMALWRQRCWVAVRSQPIVAHDVDIVGAAVGAMLNQMLAHIDPPMAYGTLHLTGATRGWQAQQLPEGWTALWLPADAE